LRTTTHLSIERVVARLYGLQTDFILDTGPAILASSKEGPGVLFSITYKPATALAVKVAQIELFADL